MYGYVYKTTNLINGRIYIGKHHGGILPGYLGSGLLLKRAIRKYGRENFRLEVLSYGSNQLMVDVHAPAKERVNGPVVKIPEFYEAFGIKQGDKMFRVDSLRVNIW